MKILFPFLVFNVTCDNDDNQNDDDVVYKDENKEIMKRNYEEENDDNDNGNDEVPLLIGCTCKVASGDNGLALSRLNAL